MKTIYTLLFALLPFGLFAQEVYHIRFTDDDTQYSVAVIMNDDNTGLVRIKYLDSECNGDMIEMTATMNETITGYVINCANPVFAGTTRKAKSYRPDTFYLTNTDNDGWICKNIDSANTVSQCSFMEVTGITNQDIFLREFGLEFTK